MKFILEYEEVINEARKRKKFDITIFPKKINFDEFIENFIQRVDINSQPIMSEYFMFNIICLINIDSPTFNKILKGIFKRNKNLSYRLSDITVYYNKYFDLDLNIIREILSQKEFVFKNILEKVCVPAPVNHFIMDFSKFKEREPPTYNYNALRDFVSPIIKYQYSTFKWPIKRDEIDIKLNLPDVDITPIKPLYHDKDKDYSPTKIDAVLLGKVDNYSWKDDMFDYINLKKLNPLNKNSHPPNDTIIRKASTIIQHVLKNMDKMTLNNIKSALKLVSKIHIQLPDKQIQNIIKEKIPNMFDDVYKEFKKNNLLA